MHALHADLTKYSQRLGPRRTRFAEAYLMMAKEANYRPAAPGDGCGHTYLTREEAHDPVLLEEEAVRYACQLSDEEDGRRFNLGCSNFTTNRAFVWVIEAARSLCGAKDDLALDLLKMAVREVTACEKKRRERRGGNEAAR